MTLVIKKIKLIFVILLFFILGCVEHIYAAEVDPQQKGQPRLITISGGIELLLKNNRLIKVALPDNEMSFQNSLVSRSALLPQVNLFANKTFNQYAPAMKFNSLDVETADKNPLTYGFDVYQTLFDFGKNLSNYWASKEILKAAKANTESVQRVATLEFIVAYFNLLEEEKIITVFEKEAESLTSYLHDIQHLYEQGVVVKNDLLPAQVRLADVKQRLIAARNDRQIGIARLNNILALPLNEEIRVQDIQMQPQELPEMEIAWNNAVSERPEIRFYNDQLQASNFAQKAKAVENLPTLFADAGYAFQQNQFVTHEDNFSLELGAKMNLYDGGAARAQFLKERARHTQLKEQKDKITEDIKFEIEDSYFGLKNASEKVLVARDALAQAEENVRFYRAKYNAGVATNTDVLEAITMQTKAEVNYCSDDYELKRNYAKLMYSMGLDLALIYGRMESKNDKPAKR